MIYLRVPIYGKDERPLAHWVRPWWSNKIWSDYIVNTCSITKLIITRRASLCYNSKEAAKIRRAESEASRFKLCNGVSTREKPFDLPSSLTASKTPTQRHKIWVNSLYLRTRADIFLLHSLLFNLPGKRAMMRCDALHILIFYFLGMVWYCSLTNWLI